MRPDGKIRDGWLDTGDLASVDADGFIRLAGPREGPDHPGRPQHRSRDDRGRAARAPRRHRRSRRRSARSALRRGARRVRHRSRPAASGPPDELEAWAVDHVPERAAAPKHVEIVDEIPLTSVGKPYKPELRRRAAERAARDALAETGLGDQVRAVLVDGAVEIHVPRSADDDEVGAVLSQYAWTWQLTN